MDAACGRRPLAQVLRNSLSGHPPPSATTRDTITSAIYSQRRVSVRPGIGYRHSCYAAPFAFLHIWSVKAQVIGTQYKVTIICQTTWLVILLY